jgi:glycosyltransferase involved in cell wall biosynthesis
MIRISILTAFFDEASSLPEFRDRLSEVLSSLDADCEIVLVDDHSSDAGPTFAREWVTQDPRVKYLRLSRNCGSHAAFSAGLANCSGDCAILLAADLQDPPETIPALLARWRDDHDVVWAARAEREGESWSTKFCAGVYYSLMRRIALPEMPATGADFLLMDRKVIDAYNRISEKHTSFLAMVLWMGFRQTTIEYVKVRRHSGSSKWTFSKKLKLLIDSCVSFSYLPIRIMSSVGMLMASCGFSFAVYVLAGRLFGWVIPNTGYAALMVALLVGQGTIIAMLGVLGEYLWRTFDEARGRPRYIVEESLDAFADDRLGERHTKSSDSESDRIETLNLITTGENE